MAKPKPFVQLALTLAAALALLPAAPTAAAPPTKSGFDLTALDKSVDPCVDFYHYACGGWEAANPIPADQTSWGRFNELAERNRDKLHQILEAAAPASAQRSPTEKLIGDYYASCMDEAAIESKGLTPLKADLDRIAAMKSKDELPALAAYLQMTGAKILFTFGSEQDFKDPSQVSAIADQGGLGLPDRDYYFRDDAKSVEQRQQYTEHVRRMFELAGESAEQARADADAVMRFETALAKVSLDKVSRRNPNNIYHLLTRQELDALTPHFSWASYLTALQSPAFASLNVSAPDYFKGLDAVLAGTDLATIQDYLRWQVLHNSAELLPKKLADEDFAFFDHTLRGAKEQRPRWKRCVDLTDDAVGFALGRIYAEQTFGAEGKARTATMVAALEKALGEDIQSLSWMTEPTKKQALVKLAAIRNKVGYPDTWRDYSKLEIVRGDALGNARRGIAFELARQLDKMGKPLDRSEWAMTPPTVNAYYHPLLNDINFPAGILQPPFFDKGLDDAVNFGGIGAVIGHEMTHGFDDSGRQFAADGSLTDWWSPEDAKEFEKRTSCIVDQYSGYTSADVKLNGKLTLGENTADHGGLRIAYLAYHNTLGGKTPARIDGLSGDQRFFLGWGQIWCEELRPELARVLAQTNPHSPGPYRVNGVVSNMPEFAQAYGCKAGQPMVRENACHVW